MKDALFGAFFLVMGTLGWSVLILLPDWGWRPW